MDDLSAVVVVRSLSAAICRLLPADGGAKSSVMKAQLWRMRDATFEWPSPDEVLHDAFPPSEENCQELYGNFFQDKWARPRPGQSVAPPEAGTLSRLSFL
jgi:hypothetical protein